jgi:Na+-transporting NADH:ubiquinone oxidoreductase subunit B
MAESTTEKAPAGKAPGPPREPRRSRLFLRQPVMRRVVYALVPILVAGIYFFGWRVLALLAASVIGGLATEWAMASRRGKPISQACFVTCFLYALSLPPSLPLWMAFVGVVVGILFGKEVFGGFGKNFANPAIVGRAFVYVAFPIEMTGRFVPAFRGFPGGFARWSMASLERAPAWLASVAKSGADAMTAATPMWARRDFGHETPLSRLFFGNIGGVFEGEYGSKVLAAGSIGEVCALLIILASIYLVATKTANWRLTVATLAGAVVANVLLRNVGGAEEVPPLLFTLFSGALLYAAVFMVTDPISAPRKKPSVWMYGVLIGALIVFLRWKAQFSGAVAFAILLGNIIGPSLDMAVAAWENRGKAVADRRPVGLSLPPGANSDGSSRAAAAGGAS